MKPQEETTEEIFTKYRNKVYRLALSITRNENDAKDVMQNAFLKIIKNLSFFRNKSQLSTWIYKIAYNESLMLLRKRKAEQRLSRSLNRKTRVSSGLFVNWAKLPDEQLLNEELKERVDLAIRQMPIKYRLALLLDNVEGLALKESAKVLGLKLNSLKTRLHRARLLIKDDMVRYFKDKEAGPQEKKARKCGIWMGFIYKYADGIAGPLGKNFKRHISGCHSCNAFLNSYLKAVQVTHALECRDIPVELTREIEDFLSREASKKA
ncbi:MAG: sigma-70 family RNA polymerase sigma factor [Candidatus Omnitrophota bacterium]